MTFGEHLEELRTSLVKAVLALVIGVLIGLLFANHLVAYVQTPLKNALEEYYSGLGAKQYHEHLVKERDRAHRCRRIWTRPRKSSPNKGW